MDDVLKELNLWINEIENYLNKEEVSNLRTNIEVISLYDLFKIIENEFEVLKNIKNQLDEKLNSSLNIFSGVKNPHVEIKVYEKSSTIYFYDNSSEYPIFSITKCKYREEKNIYFPPDKTQKNKFYYSFVEKNYDLLLNMLDIIEPYSELMCFHNRTPINQFGDDWFWVQFFGINTGNVSVEIYHNIYQNYYKKFPTIFIDDFKHKYKEEILKRIPVVPSKLPQPYNKFYDRYKEKENKKEKVKMLKI